MAVFAVGIKPFAFTHGGEGHQIALSAAWYLVILINDETYDQFTNLIYIQ